MNVSDYIPRPSNVLWVWWRNLTAWRKYYRTSILLNFGEPVVSLLGFGLGIGAFIGKAMGGISYLEFIAPAQLAITAMNAATFDILFGGRDRLHVDGVYDACITGPVTVADIAVGEYLWAGTRSVIYGLVFLVVIALLGIVHSPWVLALPLVLFLNGVLFGIPALAVACLARNSEDPFYYVTLALTPMFMFSGTFFPIQGMPGWLQVIIEAGPLYHVVTLARGLILGNVSLGMLWDVVYLVAAIAIMALLPIRLLRWRLIR